jgi:hypothetical protein
MKRFKVYYRDRSNSFVYDTKLKAAAYFSEMEEQVLHIVGVMNNNNSAWLWSYEFDEEIQKGDIEVTEGNINEILRKYAE